jgi:hypothetical protein
MSLAVNGYVLDGPLLEPRHLQKTVGDERIAQDATPRVVQRLALEDDQSPCAVFERTALIPGEIETLPVGRMLRRDPTTRGSSRITSR